MWRQTRRVCIRNLSSVQAPHEETRSPRGTPPTFPSGRSRDKGSGRRYGARRRPDNCSNRAGQRTRPRTSGVKGSRTHSRPRPLFRSLSCPRPVDRNRGHDPRRRKRRGSRDGSHDHGPCPPHSLGRARGAELPRAPLRHRKRNSPARRARDRHWRPHYLHTQDNARASRPREIRRTLRWRLQPQICT